MSEWLQPQHVEKPCRWGHSLRLPRSATLPTHMLNGVQVVSWQQQDVGRFLTNKATEVFTCETVSPARRSRVYSTGRLLSRPMRAGGGKCPMASVPCSSAQRNHRPSSPSPASDPPLLLLLFVSGSLLTSQGRALAHGILMQAGAL